ncbi:MAG: hypothetical protein H7263_08640 [Candidatus Sericytochromatia bacterium]|nr:hypothetical protein [Candidatus Sericytochromatia bacterium]
MKKRIIAILATLLTMQLPVIAKTVHFSSNSITSSIYMQELQIYNKRVAEEMLGAIAEGKLITPDYIRENIKELSNKGYCTHGYIFNNTHAYATKGLLDLLHNLVTSSEITKHHPISILSLFRTGRNHGQKQVNGDIICRAVDIDGYSGNLINMSNPNSSLKAILKVIDNMPQGRYVVGLPRPGGGSLINPNKDFFLPVNSLSQNERTPTGTLTGDLKLIKNSDARNKITKAFCKNKKAKVMFLMPDAVDHLHIKALDDNQPS